jgi:hypothetical protein
MLKGGLSAKSQKSILPKGYAHKSIALIAISLMTSILKKLLLSIQNMYFRPSHTGNAMQTQGLPLLKPCKEVLSAFDDIRPYHDREVPQVMARLATNPTFTEVIQYVFPETTEEQVRENLKKITTVGEFQREIARPAMRKLIEHTSSQVEVMGMENVKPGHCYLFISNHRDIILDSALLNIMLLEHGHDTTQTAIGNNLLSSPLITDLTKLNKNFVVFRNTGAREFYENSMRLSNYISYNIKGGHSSIWIAQREGRTKDGLDKTQPGLLKMLSIGCDDPLRYCFKDLNVTPVAISYEYDPCDVLKIPELKAVSRDEKYEKNEGEDVRSILTGLTGSKGRIQLSIGKTIDEQTLESLAEFPSLNDKLRVLGDIIDQQIFQLYKLWPTNYMAFNILDGDRSDKEEYEGLSLDAFEQQMKRRLKAAGLSADVDYQWLLKMYANPVKSQIACKL